MTKNLFSSVRKDLVTTVLAAAGAAGALTACSSNEANYRPAPQPAYATPAQRTCGQQPTYTQPTYTQPTYTQPAPMAPSRGTTACAKGKCG